MPRPKPPAGIPVPRSPDLSPPSSPGLPPSRRRQDVPSRRRRAHPVKAKGRPKAEQTAAIVEAARLVIEEGVPPVQAAVKMGTDASGRSVKELIKSARELFASRADFYVEAHQRATLAAAEKGNAEPAQWALERIHEGGERVVDPPKGVQGTAGSLSIGIMLGGIPQTAHQPDLEGTTVEDVPPLLPPVPEELTP